MGGRVQFAQPAVDGSVGRIGAHEPDQRATLSGTVARHRRGGQVELYPFQGLETGVLLPCHRQHLRGSRAISLRQERLQPGQIGGAKLRIGAHGTVETGGGLRRSLGLDGGDVGRESLRASGRKRAGAWLDRTGDGLRQRQHISAGGPAGVDDSQVAHAHRILEYGVDVQTAAYQGEVALQHLGRAHRGGIAQGTNRNRFHMGGAGELEADRFGKTAAHPFQIGGGQILKRQDRDSVSAPVPAGARDHKDRGNQRKSKCLTTHEVLAPSRP